MSAPSTPTEYIKVGSLKPNLANINIIVKVMNVSQPRVITSRRSGREHKIAEALVGDETGAVLLTLWDDQIKKVETNDTIEIRNGYTTLFKGSLRLNAGKAGTLEKAEKEIKEVNTKNNLSRTTYIQIPWETWEATPYRRRRRRR
ncbi:hypothetical protein DRO55_06375 [Candidatus Bathyarchaeota archaeon]|nr:MAG: hypothetical protein DRO55_06375 [Candidatus Bathyarchaeota archaeon]